MVKIDSGNLMASAYIETVKKQKKARRGSVWRRSAPRHRAIAAKNNQWHSVSVSAKACVAVAPSSRQHRDSKRDNIITTAA